MLNQPMSSPMMTTMFGFFVGAFSWAAPFPGGGVCGQGQQIALVYSGGTSRLT